jgi:hypothetical protein
MMRTEQQIRAKNEQYLSSCRPVSQIGHDRRDASQTKALLPAAGLLDKPFRLEINPIYYNIA